MYAENAYVALLRDIEALSSQVQPPSPLAPTVPALLTVALSETVHKAQEGWKKITRYRKKAKLRVSRGIERALKKEAQHEQVIGHKLALKLNAAAGDAGLEGGRERMSQLDGAAGGNVAVVGAGAIGALGKLSLLAKRKGRSGPPATSISATGRVVEDAEDGSPILDEDKAGDGDDEDSDEKEPPPSSAVMSLPPFLPSSSTVAFSPPSGLPSTPLSLGALPVSLASLAASAVLPSACDSQAPVVMSCSNFPIAVLHVPVQRQYTMTRKDSKRIKREEKEALVNVSVRIMGTPDASFLYFVAKDVCQLICLRKGSVAKAIHEFSNAEKARMPVMCQRSSGSGCTQVLTVLTVQGVQRLMNASRQPIAKSVLQWIMEKIAEIRHEKKTAPPQAPGAAPITAELQLQPPQPPPLPIQRRPPDVLPSAPHRDDLSSSAASVRGPSTLSLSMPASGMSLGQAPTFSSESADAFLQSALAMPSRPGGGSGHEGLHSPSQPSFGGPVGPSLLSSQYLTSSNPLSSYGSMHSSPFSTLQSFAPPYGGLQPQSSSHPLAQSHAFVPQHFALPFLLLLLRPFPPRPPHCPVHPRAEPAADRGAAGALAEPVPALLQPRAALRPSTAAIVPVRAPHGHVRRPAGAAGAAAPGRAAAAGAAATVPLLPSPPPAAAATAASAPQVRGGEGG